MDPITLKITVAALLHDVGKFMQRAEVPLAVTTRELENLICKPDHGRYTHRHVLWTREFFDFFEGHPVLAPTRETDSVANLASYHHNPASALQGIIQLADCLSSGADRMKDEEPHGNQAYKKERLHSIFEHVRLDASTGTAPRHRHELDPLDPAAENLFPTKIELLNPPSGALITSGYSELWQGFIDELRSIPVTRPEHFIAPLLSLLEKYTWCIASSTMDRPDISLFDHARTTAAIAAALHLNLTETGRDSTRLTTESDAPAFLLLVGDLSGIQDYIFNIKNVGAGGAAKRLRARSFFVSALSDMAALKFLDAFGVSLANLVMGSGGKFYLLLPNLADAQTRVDTLGRDMNLWLMENLNSELGINLAATPFSCREFREFSAVLKRANDQLTLAKAAPLRAVLTNPEGGWNEERFLFQHVHFDTEESLCQACGRFPGVQRNAEQAVMCGHCHNDVELGRKLAKGREISFRFGKSGAFPIFADCSIDVHDRQASLTPDAVLVLTLNDWDLTGRAGPVRSRYFANHVPRFDASPCQACDARDCKEKDNARASQPKFFSCLAQSSPGRKALGVLKADVDNLGLMFMTGFRSERERSISRIATLSRMLDAFFTGRVDALLRDEFPGLYTVYAGGDDLLLLGPWADTLRFARKLRDEFRQFTCGNPDFTLSAGMAQAKPRLPILSVVESADHLLDAAKKETALDADRPKDQFATLGDRFKWSEAERVHAEAERLAEWLAAGTGRLSMGTVRQLLDSAGQYRRFRRTGETEALRFVPMLAYAISRNIDSRETEVVAWLHELTGLDSTNLRHLTYIANYAIALNRS